MDKCPCSMTALEILQSHIERKKPIKSILIIDKGHRWEVTMFGPDAAGLSTEHIIIPSALEAIERCMVNLRRQSDVDAVGGEVVTDPEEIVRLLGAK